MLLLVSIRAQTILETKMTRTTTMKASNAMQLQSLSKLHLIRATPDSHHGSKRVGQSPDLAPILKTQMLIFQRLPIYELLFEWKVFRYYKENIQLLNVMISQRITMAIPSAKAAL